MTSIAERLKNLRSTKGVNQDTAAEACDMSRVALARYETGARIPRAENAARLADYYGVTVDYLLGREDQPAPAPAQEKAPDDDLTARIMAKARIMNEEELKRLLRIMDAVMEEG